MTAVIDLFRGHPWAALVVLMGAFVVLLLALIAAHRVWRLPAEISRKIVHAASGLLTLTFPFVFDVLWPVLLLTVGSALILGVLKFVPAARRRFGGVTSGVRRTTLGELYFPLSVALLFWLNLGGPPLLFVVPILVLTVADTMGALVGVRYGQHQFTGAAKTLEGSVAVVIAASFCIHIPLLLWTAVGRLETVLMALTLSLLVMLLEGSAWRGLDNLFIPIGGFFLLRAYLPLDAPALLARSLVTVGLVLAVVVARRSSTLVDDSLLAGAFLCYVTWALAGWPWLVPPAMLFVSYAWFSPRTRENSRRIHGLAVIGAVWSGAMLWLALALVLDEDRLLYPFTIVFACHLAIFGLSRLAYANPRRSLGGLTLEAVTKSWVLLFVPFVVLGGATIEHLQLAALAIMGIAGATLMFVRSQRGIRDTPVDRGRWIRQAASAAGGSAIGWIAMVLRDRMV